MSSSSPNGIQPYKYNGKELDRTKSLNLYDYGARQYDPLLARWHVVDPMAEKYYTISPYVYA
jgi:RHS repeat-associated protein